MVSRGCAGRKEGGVSCGNKEGERADRKRWWRGTGGTREDRTDWDKKEVGSLGHKNKVGALMEKKEVGSLVQKKKVGSLIQKKKVGSLVQKKKVGSLVQKRR